MLLLVTALLQALRCAAATTVTRLTIDAADLGPMFDGVGGNSGGGGGTRLLVDYPPAQRSDLLDLMFKPKFGMSLQHIKVEIGSDGDTTQGSEPTHARSPTDINFDRGYEVWLMEQAVQRRPGIQLSGLEWGVPGWVAAAPGGFWSDAAISYLTGWAKGLRDVKGLNLTALGVAWNERSYNTTFIKAMRKSLDAAGLKHVKTIAPDSWGRMWQIVRDMQKDPELAAAIDIVGTHQECTGASNEMPPAGTGALGKKLWSTEQHIGELGKFGGCDSSKPFVPSVAMPVELDLPSWDRSAGLTLARSINQGFIVANMTSTLIWTPTYSWYEWIKYAGKGLVVANTPWSGWYSVPDAVWCVAHTTQFTEVGWRFSGPGGSKMLADGAGSAVSYVSPDGRDLSVVVETAASNATNELEIELRGFDSVDHVRVWRTLSPDPKNVFAQQTPLAVVKGQPLQLSVAAGEMLTLSTTTGQRKGSDGLKIPPPSNFSALLPHIDDFELYAEDTTPKYSSDMSGVYSVATVQGLGKVLRQRTALQPAATHEGNSALGNFATTFGDASLFDYELQITARLLKPAADGSSPATDAAAQAPHAAPFLFVSVQMSDGGPNSSSCVLSGKPLPPVCCERLAPHAPYCGCCSIGKGGFAPSDLHEELAPGGPLLKFTFEAGKTTWSLQHSRPIKVLAEGQLDWPIFSWKTVSLSAKRGADGNATLTARAGGKQLASVSVTLSPYAWRGPAAFGQAINEAAPFSEWDNMTIRKLPDNEQGRTIWSSDEGSLPDFDLAHVKPIKTDDKEQEDLTPQWETVSSHAAPVIGPAQTTPHGVYQGFETGQFFKNNGTYYVAINELGLCTSVIWDRTTRAALWSAQNASGPWSRVTTLRNTSSMYSLCSLGAGKGLTNGCSWAPTLVFAPSIANGSKPVWNMFYSACEDMGGRPSPNPKLPKDKPGDGIAHAVSTTDSIEGPYVDMPSELVQGSSVVMPFSHAFTTWKLRNGSYMSFRNNVPGATDFSVGLERAIADGGRTLGGPWAYDNNSVPFPCGPENPIVSPSSDGQFFYAVYDALEQVPAAVNDNNAGPSCTEASKRALCTSKTECDKIGVAWSPDGVTWSASATTTLRVQTDGHHPCGQIRTPLGLVAEPELCTGCYSVLWTGYSTLKGTDRAGYTPVCHAVIRQKNERSLKSDDDANVADPIYHFWPTTSQSQDPSGVLQTADGRWHVFPDCAGAPYNFSQPEYQSSGLMWCHFSSHDLVHWTEHPPALAPNSAVASADVFTGSIVDLKNGSHWAIFATVNVSHNTTTVPHGTFCTGNIAAAISHDPLLEDWTQLGTVINNDAYKNKDVDANFCSLQDPTTPWLGECTSGSGQCWNVVLGSGNNNASSPNFGNLGLLYRTSSATDLFGWQYVSVLFKSAHTPYFRPGYLFSCPDFFRLSNVSDVHVFLASENPYANFWTGKYDPKNGVFTPSLSSPRDLGLNSGQGVVPKTGAIGGASAGGRRVSWGFISTWDTVKNVRKLQCGGKAMPCVQPALMHGQSVMSLPLEMMLSPSSTEQRPVVDLRFVPELAALRIAGATTTQHWGVQPASPLPKDPLRPTHAELAKSTLAQSCGSGTQACSRHFELNATITTTNARGRYGVHLLTTPLMTQTKASPLVGFSRRGPILKTINASAPSPDFNATAEACAATCESEAQCLSWTWIPWGPFCPNPFVQRCELRAALTPLESWQTMQTGLSSRAVLTAEDASYFESVLVGHDAKMQQLFVSRELCGHSMPDLECPTGCPTRSNPFWRTFTNLTLATGEDLQLHAYVDGPIIEVVANARAILSLSAWPAVNAAVSLGAFGGAAVKQASYYSLRTNLRTEDLA